MLGVVVRRRRGVISIDDDVLVMVAAIVATAAFFVCRSEANAIIAQTRGCRRSSECGGSNGCRDVLPGQLGVIVRRWRGGGIGVGNELWQRWLSLL